MIRSRPRLEKLSTASAQKPKSLRRSAEVHPEPDRSRPMLALTLKARHRCWHAFVVGALSKTGNIFRIMIASGLISLSREFIDPEIKRPRLRKACHPEEYQSCRKGRLRRPPFACKTQV